MKTLIQHQSFQKEITQIIVNCVIATFPVFMTGVYYYFGSNKLFHSNYIFWIQIQQSLILG